MRSASSRPRRLSTSLNLVSILASLCFVSGASISRADFLINPPAVQALTNDPQPAALAADMRGRMLLLGGKRDAMTVAASSDDGRTWTTPAIIEATPGRYSGAALCVDRFGRAYAAWRFEASGTDPGEIHFASFRFVEAATGSIPNLAILTLDKGFDITDSGEPVLDCNEEGMALVVWPERRTSGGGHDLLGSLVDVFDRAATRTLKMSAPLAEDNRAPDVDLRAEGIWYVVFQAVFPNRSDIYLATRSPMGTGASVRKIPTEGAVVPPILVHDEIEPRLARQSGLVPATEKLSRQLVVAWLDDRDGFFRTSVTFSEDGGKSWYTDINLPTHPDAGACAVAQADARVCRGSAGVVAGFRCTDPSVGGNIAFTNSSLDLGATWESATAQPLDDESSTAMQAFELQCNEGLSRSAHAALRVSPRDGRQHHVGGRGPQPGFVFEAHTEPADGLPQDQGEFVSLAHDEGQAWISIDLRHAGVMAVNGTTAETRLNVECASGVCPTSQPTIAHGEPPYMHAAWVSQPTAGARSILAATSPDMGGHWVPSAGPVAVGNLSSPLLLATGGSDVVTVSPVMTLYLDRGMPGSAPVIESSLSIDRGASWSPSGQVNTTPLAGNVRISGMGVVVAGRPGFYASWISDTGVNGEVRFSFLGPMGWSPDVRLDTPPGPLAGHPVGRPLVAGDDGGNVCVFWEDHRDPSNSQIRANCSNDGGATFQIADTRLDDPAGFDSVEPDVTTDGRGHYAVVWRELTPFALGDSLITRHACQVGGGDPAGQWSTPIKVPTVPSAGVIHSPQISLETGGHAVVAWDNGFRTFANASSDWGNNYAGSSVPLELCATPGAPAADCGDGVRLLATPDGGVGLVLQRADPAGLGVWAMTAEDFGAMSWQGPFDLTPDGANGFEPDTGGAAGLALQQELHRPPMAVLAAWGTTGNTIAEPDVAANRWRMPSGVPLEVKAVRAGETGRFVWEPFDFPSGAEAVYNVYRGALPPQPSSLPWQCLAAHLPAPEHLDPDTPGPGKIFGYIMTGAGPGGEGPTGTIIPVASCEPPPTPCF